MRKQALWVQIRGIKQPKKKKKVKFVRRISEALAAELKKYKQLKILWKSKPENKHCRVCQASASELHHARGRLGPLLCDERHWIPLCWRCHRRVHAEIEWARENGLIAKKGEWNKYDS